MKKYTFLLFFGISYGLIAQQNQNRTIKGEVRNNNDVVENAVVSINGKESVYTNSEGEYSINANTDDTLSYSYQGLKTVEIKVEDVTRVLNVDMKSDAVKLDEVVLNKQNSNNQEALKQRYGRDENIIRTSFGYVDKDTYPGQLQIKTEVELVKGGNCLTDLLYGLPNVVIKGTCNAENAKVYVRERLGFAERLNVLYDIDGFIYREFPYWLDLNTVKRVALFYGGIYTNRYSGNSNIGGVLVVNTDWSLQPNFQGREKLSAESRENYLTTLNQNNKIISNNLPSYERTFKLTNSLEEAKAVYGNLKESNDASPYFYIDAVRYFSRFPDSDKLIESILQDAENSVKSNPVLLKSLAYVLEESQMNVKANGLYKRVYILRPKYAQSYRDLFHSYLDIGNEGSGMHMYTRYNYLVQENLLPVSKNFMKLFEKEVKNESRFFRNFKNKFKRFDLADNGEKRMVFEWSDSEAEFNLNFVAPNGETFTWEHSLNSNAEVIGDEKHAGFNTTELVMDSFNDNDWLVTVSFKGNKSLTPTYLKLTTYYDYGSKNQSKDVKVFKLRMKNTEQKLYGNGVFNSPKITAIPVTPPY